MSTHAAKCGCAFCNSLKSRVMNEQAWREQHALHLLGAGDAFTTEPFEHPSGRCFWLVCHCGARLLTMTKAATS